MHSSLHRVAFLLCVEKCQLSASSNKNVCIKLWEVHSHMSDKRALMGEIFVYCSFFYMLMPYYSLWLLYYMIFHSIYTMLVFCSSFFCSSFPFQLYLLLTHRLSHCWGLSLFRLFPYSSCVTEKTLPDTQSYLSWTFPGFNMLFIFVFLYWGYW